MAMADYEPLRLRVDPTPEHPDGWAEFVGKEVGHTSRPLNHGERGTVLGIFTLYDTPSEGYMLYAVEASNEAQDDVRRPGQRAAEVESTRVLYSEEEARQRYPGLLDRLLGTTED